MTNFLEQRLATFFNILNLRKSLSKGVKEVQNVNLKSAACLMLLNIIVPNSYAGISDFFKEITDLEKVRLRIKERDPKPRTHH